MALEMKYFVLKPKGDNAYAAAARDAMLSYACMIEDDDAQLADELRQWVASEEPDHVTTG